MLDRNCTLAILLSILLAAPAAAEPPRGEFEVHDLSLWITDGADPVANARASYASAFPAIVTSSRAPRPADAATAPAPVGLITFYGRPAGELDVELRVKGGSFLGYWPPGEIAGNRLLWPRGSGIALIERPANESALTWVDADHWMQQARQSNALFVQSRVRAERFLAYDAELKLPSPVRLHGGPDNYRVVNDSDATLYDVVLVRSTPEGLRVAWLDELPRTEVKQSGAAAPSATPAADQAKRTAGLFAPARPRPAASAGAPKAAPQEQAAAGPTLGNSSGRLFGLGVPKNASAAARDNPPPLVGGVELVLSDPLAAGSDEAHDKTFGELAKRLGQAGLSADEIDLFLSQYSSLLFEQERMIVACRLDPATIDKELTLSVFPVPEKIVRVPVLLVRNVDPQLPQHIDQLIEDLGAESFADREQAEKQLILVGSRAFESLNKAINHSDMEIVIRAERILLNQGQRAAGRQGATGTTAAQPTAPGKVAPAK